MTVVQHWVETPDEGLGPLWVEGWGGIDWQRDCWVPTGVRVRRVICDSGFAYQREISDPGADLGWPMLWRFKLDRWEPDTSTSRTISYQTGVFHQSGLVVPGSPPRCVLFWVGEIDLVNSTRDDNAAGADSGLVNYRAAWHVEGIGPVPGGWAQELGRFAFSGVTRVSYDELV